MPDSCMGDGHSALRGCAAVLMSQAKPQKMGPTCPPTRQTLAWSHSMFGFLGFIFFDIIVYA